MIRRTAAVLLLLASPALAQREDGGLPADGLPPREVTAPSGIDLAAEVARYSALVADPAQFHAGNAEAVMLQAYAEVFALDPSEVDFAALDRDPHGLTQALFQVTTQIDDRMAEFDAQGAYTAGMAAAKRRVLRAIRYLREMTVVHTTRRQPDALYAHGRPAIAQDFPDFHWVVRPEYRQTSLAQFPRTWLVLCMGNTNVSATIARSANEDNTFSHLAVGYRSTEPKTVEGKVYPAGTAFIVESLIETGVIIKPYANHYSDITRDVVFFVRDRDAQDAVDAAADRFFDRANDAIAAGEPLGYDFSMGTATRGLRGALAGEDPVTGTANGAEFNDITEYFCAGVAEDIFRQAGVELFEHLSPFNVGPGSQDLFETWDIDTSIPVTAPGDAEVSTALVRVAEACRAANVPANVARQAVLAEILDWVDNDHYRLRWPLWFSMTSGVMSTFNDTFLDLGMVPSGMPTDALRTFYALDKAAGLHFDHLQAHAPRFEQSYGRPMTFPEMREYIRRHRDSVDGTRTWLRYMPPAIGTFQLEGRWNRQIRLTISNGPGMDLAIERVEYRGDRVYSRARGTASQSDRWLNATFRDRDGRSAPRTMRFRLSEDGQRIDGYQKEDDHGRDRGAPRSRRTERGQRVE